MKREIIRVEPLSTYLERWKAPASAVTRHGDTVYVSAFPPFDAETGEIIARPIEQQTEIALRQMKLCLETAGSTLDQVQSATFTARPSRSLPPIVGTPFNLRRTE